ncbi:tetratricopeptide repeat protein [Kamptonema animale CS-326]|jgi:tetratricopeptide (TPR) repeat protein|uniref:tetratricopeptide repeat protein n=1 Tax=Kamptonema animale TaxID=92934 RepID=UPI00232B874D|nr:tetratricopeptide repeat protein [Kamptonema animale]MDB9512327.1 tetratricopeptide repeat protein [Kamptonema animale CS-326]
MLNQDAKTWLDRGNEQYERGDFEGAIASYNKAIEIKPDKHVTWNNRGVALFNLGRNEEAIASLDKAIEFKPDDYDAWYNRGNMLGHLGRFEDAIASLDKAIEFKPDKHQAWNSRGNALRHLGRFEDAIASCDKAIEIKPDYHEAWKNRAEALYNLGRYEEALASCDKAIEIKPDYHEAWHYRGLARYNSWRSLLQIPSFDLDDDSLWDDGAVALDNLRRNEEALASFDKAIEIKPDYHEAWKNRAVALDDLGRYEEAIASCDKAIEIKPDYHEAWKNRAEALDKLGRYEEAIASLDKAIEIKPDKHEAWYNRGLALDDFGLYEEVLASLDKAIEIKPDYHEAWHYRGFTLHNLGRIEEAIASLDKIIEIKPDYQEAWHYRGWALANLGRYEEAIASYDKAIEIRLDDDCLWDDRAEALDKLGRYEEAIASFDKATTQPPPDLDWIKTIAKIGNSSDGIAFEKLCRKSLIELGFGNSNSNPKASLDPELTGGPGGLDFYCETPYQVVGECKATKSEAVADGTPAQLIKLGHKHLQEKYKSCIKIIMAAGQLNKDAKQTAIGNHINVIRPETLQKLVELKAKHPGSINLLELKACLEQQLFGEDADAKLNAYINKILEEIKLRSHIISILKQYLENTGHERISVEALFGAYGMYKPPKKWSREDLHEILIELSSPLTGYLGRIKGESLERDSFYFLRDLIIDE